MSDSQRKQNWPSIEADGATRTPPDAVISSTNCRSQLIQSQLPMGTHLTQVGKAEFLPVFRDF